MPLATMLYTLVADEAEARRIAHILVEEGLVGCANIGAGVTSIYRWQGKVEEAGEVPVIFKLAPERLNAAMARLTELHPYDEPAILSWAADTTPGFGDWLKRGAE